MVVLRRWWEFLLKLQRIIVRPQLLWRNKNSFLLFVKAMCVDDGSIGYMVWWVCFFFLSTFSPAYMVYYIYVVVVAWIFFSGLIWGPEWMEVKQVSLTEVCSSNLFVMLFFPLVDYKHHNNKKKINSYSIVNKLKWDTHLHWFCCT